MLIPYSKDAYLAGDHQANSMEAQAKARLFESTALQDSSSKVAQP